MYVIKPRRQRFQAPLWLSLSVIVAVTTGALILAYLAFSNVGAQEHEGLPLRSRADVEKTSIQEPVSGVADSSEDSAGDNLPTRTPPRSLEPRIPAPWVTDPSSAADPGRETAGMEPGSLETEGDETSADMSGGQPS